MAFFALVTVASRVNIIDAVTGDAFPCDILIALVGVATVARGFLVFAAQREFGLAMVKATGFPCLDAVALVALLAQATLMGVVLVVAVVTCRRRITVLFPFFMAAGARESQVCAFQWKIGLMMIEGVRVEVDNISIASNMLGVAGFTGPFFDIFYAPVESSLFLDIRRDLLVAFETPFFLRVLAERLVAFFTLGFIFGMVAYHLARHDQSFQAGGGGSQ